MASDVLSIQGARALGDLVLVKFARNTPVSVPEGLAFFENLETGIIFSCTI